jgi:penicillin V acylase-like amidase (Ntn superfamily)
MVRKCTVAVFAAASMIIAQAQACTGVRLIADDGGVVPGRTLEFGFDLKSNVIVLPKGTTITGSTPDGGKGLTYKTKYGMPGAAEADYTLWTSVADLKNLKWFFRTYNDQSIRAVDLPAAIAAAKGKTKIIKMDSKQPIEDISK